MKATDKGCRHWPEVCGNVANRANRHSEVCQLPNNHEGPCDYDVDRKVWEETRAERRKILEGCAVDLSLASTEELLVALKVRFDEFHFIGRPLDRHDPKVQHDWVSSYGGGRFTDIIGLVLLGLMSGCYSYWSAFTDNTTAEYGPDDEDGN